MQYVRGARGDYEREWEAMGMHVLQDPPTGATAVYFGLHQEVQWLLAAHAFRPADDGRDRVQYSFRFRLRFRSGTTGVQKVY